MDDDFPIEIEDSEDEKEEMEEILIKENDWILMAGKIDQEFSTVEVYIFEPETGNLFVHHDFILSAFPVCIEWLGMNLFQIEN